MALLDNSAQVNTITPRDVNEHSLQVGPITDLMGSKVTCVGLGNTYTRLLSYVVIWVQVDRVWGYNCQCHGQMLGQTISWQCAE